MTRLDSDSCTNEILPGSVSSFPTFCHLDMLGLAHIRTDIVRRRKEYEGENLLTLVDCGSPCLTIDAFVPERHFSEKSNNRSTVLSELR